MPCAPHDVHLEIYSAIEALELVHVVVEHVARRLGVEDDRLQWMAIAVRESVMNAITHGNQADSEKRVFIDLTAAPDADPTDLVIRVRDQGRGFDPALLDDPRSPEKVLSGNGRGIFLIRQLMDDVSVQTAPEGGMEMRMSTRIRG